MARYEEWRAPRNNDDDDDDDDGDNEDDEDDVHDAPFRFFLPSFLLSFLPAKDNAVGKPGDDKSGERVRGGDCSP